VSASCITRSLLAGVAAMVVVVGVVGCTADSDGRADDRDATGTSGDMIGDVSDAGDLARSLALDAAHRTLEALPATATAGAAPGSTRVSACTDALGAPTGARFAEYSSGSGFAPGALADDDLDRLASALDVEFLEDAVDVEGRRLVAFVVEIDGTDVVVRVSRLDNGAGVLTATTPCIG
jgi:hypothetical protein